MSNFQKIQLTRSGTTGAVPAASDLELGELAINYKDGKLFAEVDSSVVDLVDINNGSGGIITADRTNNRIGINQTSPSEALHVTGTIRLDGSVGQFGAIGEDAEVLSRKEYIQFSRTDSNDTSSGTDGARIYSDATGSNTNSGDLVLSLADDTATGGQSFIIRNESGANSGGEGTGYVNIAVFQQDSSMNAEVGIGTETPQAGYELTLHQNPSTGSNSKMLLRASNGGFCAIDFGDQADNDIGSIIYNHADNSMRFDTADAEAIRIDSSQNVGIGTSSPNGLLELATSGENRLIISSTGTSDAVLQLTTGTWSSNKDWTIRLDNDDSDQMEWRYGNSHRMSLTTAGNLGIGTTSPVNKLDVNGDAAFQNYVRITEGSGNQKLLMGNQDGGGGNKPAILMGVNGGFKMGYGDSWSTEGGNFTETVDFSGGNISTSTAPTSGNHLTNKTYVDSVTQPRGSILEMLSSFCNGTTLTGNPKADGTARTFVWPDVDAGQQLSTSYAVYGSELDYEPPANWNTIIFKFYFMHSAQDTHGLMHGKAYIENDVSAGSFTEFTDAFVTFGTKDNSDKSVAQFNIQNNTTDLANGQLNSAEWTTPRKLKWMFRDYGSSNDHKIHVTDHSGGDGTDRFSRPILEIIAIA